MNTGKSTPKNIIFKTKPTVYIVNPIGNGHYIAGYSGKGGDVDIVQIKLKIKLLGVLQ